MKLFITLPVLAISIATTMQASAETTGTPRIIAIDGALPESALPITSPDKVAPYYEALDDTHLTYTCVTKHVFETKEAAAEVCVIEPVTLRIDHWPETEFVQLVEGEVSVTDHDGGATRTFVAGDTFILPQGFRGVWKQQVRIRKLTVRHPIHWKD